MVEAIVWIALHGCHLVFAAWLPIWLRVCFEQVVDLPGAHFPEAIRISPMDIAKENCYLLCNVQRSDREQEKSEALQGTLDLMILMTLHGLGPRHGFGLLVVWSS